MTPGLFHSALERENRELVQGTGQVLYLELLTPTNTSGFKTWPPIFPQFIWDHDEFTRALK